MHIFITYIPVFFFEIYGFLDFCQYGNLTDLPKFIQIFFYSETIGTKFKVDRTVHYMVLYKI